MEVIRTGLLGLGGPARLLLEVVCKDDRFQLVGLADRDAGLVRRLASELGCEGYDDFRQFLINCRMDCLVVCEPLHRCLDHIKLGIERGINILKLAPMARGLPEAQELVGAASHAGTRYDVLMLPGQAQAIGEVFALDEGQGLRPVFLVSCTCEYGLGQQDRDLASWMPDRALAGGGVLLYQGYGLVTQLIRQLGMPSKVYCQACHPRSGKASAYLSEDAVAMVMRFPNNCAVAVNLIRYWDRSDCSLTMKVYIGDQIRILEDQQILITDGPGRQVARSIKIDLPDTQARSAINEYASSLLGSEDEQSYDNTKLHIQVMVVIQAAYISAQTGFPEDPVSLFSGPTRS
ncbi:MAG: Gfo/Idh/MocA family oxidoreductase [Sedimentisphaerales bacterium]|jgi:predicted dehydrogenase|nr:Gfo/Idh/MocA family oxidoreductase [Sedimentisphaerales bacterium]